VSRLCRSGRNRRCRRSQDGSNRRVTNPKGAIDEKQHSGRGIVALSVASARGQPEVLTNDPLTGLPLISATVLFKNVDNQPDKMPDGQVCKSKTRGEFYSLSSPFSQNKIKIDAATAWYASHLSGFKKIQGYESGRSQTAFYNSDRTMVIFLTGYKARRARIQTPIP
jgi:hypothetical protein